MARRSTRRKAPRRSRTISALNILESYSYASILSMGALGSSPYEAVFGPGDLSSSAINPLYGSGATQAYMDASGAQSLSLADMIKNPTAALNTVSGNVMANWQYMAVSSFAVGIGFKLGKRLLRAPIRNVNRNLMKPLGIGVRL
tara:strand:- start:24 stop:455 length:432 start_codon:yes stop_codon:yes gene_type:complete